MSLAAGASVLVASAASAAPTHETAPVRAQVAAADRRAPLPAGQHPTGLTSGGPGEVVSGLTRAANGTVRVEATGSATTIRRRVDALGGRVLAAAAGTASIVVPSTRVNELAATSGITGVRPLLRPVADSTTVSNPAPGPSQAVSASGAQSWITAGITGAGQKVAIVDIGFGSSQTEYQSELSAGHLGANTQLINEDCTDQNNTPTPYDDPHGLAVAELAQQQAPDAQLYLYCVNSQAAVASAELAIEQAGIKIVSSSLSWFGDARGDGTGPTGSVAATVARARQHDILWFESTGNYVPQHWSGSLTDSNHDHVLDMGNSSPTAYPFESDFFYTAPSSGTPTSLAFIFQWDQWPATAQVTLEAVGLQCMTAIGDAPNTNGDCNGQVINGGVPLQVSSSGSIPSVSLSTDQYADNTAYPQIWKVWVALPGAFPANAHYDLFGVGDTYYASDLSCPSANADGSCKFAAAAVNGSLTSPSNSPYAVGVGAADVGADGTTPGTLEYFSSQGPTIDGRVKPDITGWDGESSYVSEFSDGFYGTSAATPVVAGTAALVAQQNPSWDVAQIQNFLEQRASSGSPHNPPLNSVGHGLLTLGDPTTSALPSAYGFTTLATPTRILAGKTLGAAGTYTVPVPTSVVPAGAEAVAVSLNVVDKTPSTTTYLTAYPTGTSFPGVSSVNVSHTDPQVQTTSVVTLGSDGRFIIRNSAGTVAVYIDVLGYFGGPSATQGYTAVPGTRLLNTSNGIGTTVGKLSSGQYRTVSAGSSVPSSATGVVVNVMAFNEKGSGYLTVSPNGAPGTSTLVYNGYQRANLAMVGLTASDTFRVALTGAASDVIVDLVGYLSPGGAQYVPLPAPVRIYNTQTGNGGHFGPIGSAQTVTVQGAKVFDVPDSAVSLVTGVQAASVSGGSYVTLYDTPTRPAVSAVNLSSGRLVSNLDFINLSAEGQSSLYNASGSVNAYLDLFGYFIGAPAG
ncbi:MAG: S8 family serine peptidase [Actinobacteria bacterium]|nr:S8 family serine peptidase [Actinomycetota bacterium]